MQERTARFSAGNLKKYFFMKFKTFKEFLISKRGILLALLIAGIFLALATPPFYFLVGIFSISYLAYIINRKTDTYQQAFGYGFAFGLGFNLLGLYWMIFPFLIYPGEHALFIPFTFAYILFTFSSYPALACLLIFYINKQLTRKIKAINPWIYIIFFTVIYYSICELLKSRTILSVDLTGFPWNLIAYNLNFSLYLIQVNGIFGVYGTGFILTFLSTIPAVYLIKKAPLNRMQFFDILKNHAKVILYIIPCTIFLVTIYIYGIYRIQPTEYTDIKIALIHQNNYKEYHKNDVESIKRSFAKLIEKSKSFPDADIIIWPESSLPFAYDYMPDSFSQAIRRNLQPQQTLIFGIGRKRYIEPAKNPAKQEKTSAIKQYQQGYYNSLLVSDIYQNNVVIYDKITLVPFGEYNPYIRALGGLVTEKTYFKGTERKPITISLRDGSKTSFLPLICYDAIFSDRVRLGTYKNSHAATWMINITNDVWMHRIFSSLPVKALKSDENTSKEKFLNLSNGTYQYFENSRIRTVEEGIPMARVSNVGVTALIDSYGRILHRIEPYEDKIIFAKLPQPGKPTFFSAWGNWIVFFLLTLASLICVVYYISIQQSKE